MHVAPSSQAINDAIFAEVNYHASYEPMRCVRTSRYKYIKRIGDDRRVVASNCDDGPSKDLWMQHGWSQQEHGDEAFFDLMFDPNECCNRMDDPQYARPIEQLRKRLGTWMDQTQDLAREGSIVAPQGARITDRHALSPDGTIVPE